MLRKLLGAALLFISACSGQEDPSVTFRAQTKLVMLSFHVTHGKNYVTDLQQKDVILLEDGKPREFTIFDSPATQGRMPLELVLLFDTNPQIPYFWDPAAVYKFIPHWDENMSRAILETDKADLRMSVYRCAGQELYRVRRATTDPKQLTEALAGLLAPEVLSKSPGGAVVQLHLPPRREHVDPGPFTEDYATSAFVSAEARGWPLEAGIAVLDEMAAASDKVARILVMFGEGIGATTTIPEDVGNEALDMGIPIYPVVTNYLHHIHSAWPRNLFRMRQFESLGKMTGGRPLDYPEVDAAALRKILESVKGAGLSQYVVGFVPDSASARPKGHKLEIRLAPKTSGSLDGGKRRAVY